MFLTDSHAPQILPREAYTDPEYHQREIQRVLLPAWHLIGTTRELPREGSFFNRTICGRSVLVSRLDGSPRAFLNVCPHRFSQLTSCARGCNPKLRCQYHGWEFDSQGRTRKIPDAPNFRPLERDQAALKSYRIESCGQLLFVCLSDEGPSLAEFLGPNFAIGEQLFPPTSWLVSATDTVDANWKIAIENSLESYHIDTVHPKTLFHTPQESDCHHELHERHTLFAAPGLPPSMMRAVYEFLHARMGFRATRRYSHLVLYPNMFFFWHDVLCGVLVMIPLSVSRTEIRQFVFLRQGPPQAFVWNMLLNMLAPLELMFWHRVMKEDLGIMPNVQRGMESPDAPKGGLLSRREERCAHFQSYVASLMGLPLPPDLKADLRPHPESLG